MKNVVLVMVCVAALVLSAVTLVSAERPKPAEKLAIEGESNQRADRSGPAVRQLEEPIKNTAPKNRVVGTITYDDGTVTNIPAVASECFGNQFDTALGGSVNANGSVTQMQFYMESTAGAAAFVSVFGPVGGGTAASVLTSISVPVSTGWNTYTFGSPIAYTGSSFLAGVWANSTTGDLVGLGTGTVAGQGHHAMHINDIVGTGFGTISGLNALVRATGDVLVPVELMQFSID